MLVEQVGVAKVNLPAHKMLTLAFLAGTFIAFGAIYYTVVITGSALGYGPTRLIGGLAFSLGLILIVVGGAELFTGNALITMAWATARSRPGSSWSIGGLSMPAISWAPS